MSEIGDVGDVISGAVLARAVEPGAGGQASAKDHHAGNCRNCATAIVGDYCHSCGQHAHIHRTLGAFAHDLLHGVLHFEGKIWRTLPLLAWKPGELTKRYVEGQRASFVSPMALFLFSIFLMFAVVSSLHGPLALDGPSAKNAMAADLARNAQEVGQLIAERGKMVTAKRPTAAIDKKIVSAREEGQLLKSIAERGFVRGSTMRVSDDIPGWLAAPLKHATENPDLLLYKLQNNAYKYSWGLIPLSLPFMWLLFPFSRRFRLYDHMVFITYSLSFMTLLVIVATLLGAIGWSALAGFAMLIPPLHMYRQLKGAYGLTRLGALWRTILLTLFAAVAIGLFVAALFALGVF